MKPKIDKFGNRQADALELRRWAQEMRAKLEKFKTTPREEQKPEPVAVDEEA